MKNIKIIIATILLSSATASFANSVEIMYETRTPFVYKQDDKLIGLVATPLIIALEKSQASYTIVEKPSKRHLHEIKGNMQPLCAIGWFKNSERETFAKFSKPLYQDKPMGILVRKDNEKIPNQITLDQLLQDTTLSLLAKKAYSYGGLIDEKLKTFHTKQNRVSSENIKMAQLILKKRADYMFVSFEEVDSLLVDDNLEFRSIEDMPQGNKRYLICSQKVDDLFLEKLNSELQ